MKNILIAGSTGMVGRLVLKTCLLRDDIGHVTTIARQTSGISHPKLTEVLHDNFLDYTAISDHFKHQDVCFYCLGVYTGAVPEKDFRTITVDYTAAFCEMLRTHSPKTSCCYLSGQGADPSEKSRVMFARDKGTAENILLGLGFEKTYIFRPGYIYPSEPRLEPNKIYAVLRLLYKPVLSKIYPNIGITSQDLAKGMVETGMNGGLKNILENRDIRKAAANVH